MPCRELPIIFVCAMIYKAGESSGKGGRGGGGGGVVSFPVNFVNLLIYLILKEKREEEACLLRKKERK